MIPLLLALYATVAMPVVPQTCPYAQWHETVVREGRVVVCTYIMQTDCSLVKVCV